MLNKIVLDYFKAAGGKVVYLHTSFEQIVSRLQVDSLRPLFKDLTQAKELYAFRLPLYLNYAEEIIEIDRESPEVIATQIRDRLRYGL